MVHKSVRDWTSGRSLPLNFVKYPPPPSPRELGMAKLFILTFACKVFASRILSRLLAYLCKELLETKVYCNELLVEVIILHLVIKLPSAIIDVKRVTETTHLDEIYFIRSIDL